VLVLALIRLRRVGLLLLEARNDRNLPTTGFKARRPAPNNSFAKKAGIIDWWSGNSLLLRLGL
jgi:hypothetical protein